MDLSGLAFWFLGLETKQAIFGPYETDHWTWRRVMEVSGCRMNRGAASFLDGLFHSISLLAVHLLALLVNDLTRVTTTAHQFLIVSFTSPPNPPSSSSGRTIPASV